jgi:hypothetical protein
MCPTTLYTNFLFCVAANIALALLCAMIAPVTIFIYCIGYAISWIVFALTGRGTPQSLGWKLFIILVMLPVFLCIGAAAGVVLAALGSIPFIYYCLAYALHLLCVVLAN